MDIVIKTTTKMVIEEEEFTVKMLTIIRERRQELGISQEGLASMVGRETSGNPWISRIESGARKDLPIQTIFILMKALRINVIFEREEIT